VPQQQKPKYIEQIVQTSHTSQNQPNNEL